MTIKSYLVSFPERFLRSTLGLGAGVAREVGEVALPNAVRGTQLYQNVVDATLKFLIQQVGGVEGVYRDEEVLANDFLVRRTAGNGLEALGIVAFRASPVWVLAALADVCGMGRHLIPEIADALKAEGLLDRDAQFTTVDQMLDGLERTSSRLAETINTPPLDVATLRQELAAIRQEARAIPSGTLPSADAVREMWARLASEASRQERSIFETSTVLAVSAVRQVPGGLRWLTASAKVSAGRTGQVVAAMLLDHYAATLDMMRQVGYMTYARRQLRPYARAALDHYSPRRRTWTEKTIDKVEKWRRPNSEE
jgi:hypothetical protein